MAEGGRLYGGGILKGEGIAIGMVVETRLVLVIAGLRRGCP